MNPQLQLILQQAIQAFQEGNFDSADLTLKRVIQIDSKNLPALHILGLIKASQAKYGEAADFLGRAARIHPNDASIQYNLAKALADFGSHKESIPHHKKAVELAPNNPDGWLNYGKTSSNLGRYEEALAWYDKALSLKPDYLEAKLNKGATLKELKQYGAAIEFADQVLAINPNLAEAWSNKGTALNALKQYDEAIVHYDKALSLSPDYYEALINKGHAFIGLNMPDEALTSYKKAMHIKGDYVGLAGHILYTKLKLCDWTNWTADLVKFENELQDNEKPADPFIALLLSDDLAKQKKISEIYAEEMFSKRGELGPIVKKPAQDKLRLGYFSSDLYFHPVAIWLSEQLEHHDKARFELFAFSFNQVKDPMRARLENVFDHFIEVDGNSDLEVAKLSRDLGIDIAFDLCVYTGDARPGIFAMRAAPIQVSHLGFPGTSGSKYIDYTVIDVHTMPEHLKHFYTEKIAYLPCVYTYDRQRQISAELLSRQQFGLPQNGFVFTCQNGIQKITPEVFGIWMDILKTVPKSVLWLMQPNPTATHNLIKEALSHGVESDRLVFTKREVVESDQEQVRINRYLASYRLADLFLDTWPYNAGTTAADALFSGLPVLTKAGLSPVSRMATSALEAIEMPELITSSAAEYRSMAIDLATNPQLLREIRDKLARNKLTTPLFDSLTNTRYLESAYEKMYERYQAGLAPDHIFIE